jgi:hypothetical protein
VVIELDASGGPPNGMISVDGGRQNAFYGWIDLTAQLEALMTDTGVSPIRSSARAGPVPRG